jgi:hypothetical protein
MKRDQHIVGFKIAVDDAFQVCVLQGPANIDNQLPPASRAQFSRSQ